MSGMFDFARMSDSKCVVKFVKDVEMRPCLYDTKLHEYVNQELKREAWAQIAKEWNCSAAECKEKWRKIRTAYSRSLRPKNHKNKMPRPYYLASYLEFINPKARKYRKQLSNSKNIKENNSDEENDVLADSDDKLDNQDQNSDNIVEENDCLGDEDMEYYDDDATLMDDEESVSNEERKTKEVILYLDSQESPTNNGNKIYDDKEASIKNNRDRRITATNEENKTKESKNRYDTVKLERIDDRNEERCSYCTNIESRPRKMLLFSLLPDIEALSEKQMRVFRRKLIDLIDKCKDDLNDV